MLDMLKFSISAKNNSKSAFAEVNRGLKDTKGLMAGVSQQANRLGRNMRNIGAGMSLGVTAPLVGLGKSMVTLYDQQVQAEKTVSAAILSTGGAAGKTLGDLKGLASGLQAVSTFGDEDILRNVTAPLLTFTKIQGDVFDRAQASVLDYSTLLQTDLKSASVQVGKALNDPIKGVAALGKAGVQFSDAQKGVIKSLVETGDIAGAQSIILQELETQFKGQAQAAANAPLGQWKQLSNAIGDVKEELGAEIVPFLNPLVNSVKNGVKWFSELSPEVKRNTVIIGGLAAAVGPVVAALGLTVMGATAVGGAFATMGAVVLANPIFAAIAALAVGATFVYRNWDGIKSWFQERWSGVKSTFANAWTSIKATLSAYTPASLIFDNWGGISEWFKTTFSTVRSAMTGDWDAIKTLLLNYTPHGLIYNHWDGIGGWFSEKIGAIGASFWVGWELIKQDLATNYSPQILIKNAWQGIGAWFSSLSESVVNGFKDIWEGVRAEVTSWPDRMIQVGKDVVGGLISGMFSRSGEVEVAAGSVGRRATRGAKKALDSNSPSKVFMAIGRDIVDGLAIGVRQSADTAVSEVRGLGEQVADEARASTGVLGSFRDSAKGIFTSVLTGAQSFRGALGGVLGGFGNKLLTSGVDQLFDAVWPFAKGGVISQGKVTPYAKGGVVSSPTTFGMAGNNTGLMGEAGPEGILPLARDSSGKLGVRSQGGGGGGSSMTLNFAPVIDARGADSSAVARLQAQLEAQAKNLERNVHQILQNGRNRRHNLQWQGAR